ncbi:MAG: cysteine--tRNA ligase [Candidatus Tritonobacter lacicola]|nr:cysteine--tRNA ligase [Candidatus Tritonobacter lacicola]
MALKIHNTLSGEKDPFELPEGSRVTMYVCGVTVYDECHVGHARALVVFDMIQRYLKHLGYNVVCVRNFTDVDDKIIKRANEEGVTCDEIASRYIHEFREDVGRLGLLQPAYEPRATEHIADMIGMISTLAEKGHAYEVAGDVFFAVSSFSDYGKLSGRNLEDLRAGARVEVDEKKRNPLDFALWKKAKPGEPSWDSPWGRGRPGWHIECSAMSLKLLGETIDIHGGGQDLIFPHHENEIAQSECCTGKPFARFWIHNGHVMIRDEKMSKSLGNFFTLKQVYEEYEPRILHFFLISKHYRSPLDFSKEGLSEAREALSRLDNCLGSVENAIPQETIEDVRKNRGKVRVSLDIDIKEPPPPSKHKWWQLFETAMHDDFNTPGALAAIFMYVGEINNELKLGYGSGSKVDQISLVDKYDDLRKLCDILGICYKPLRQTTVSLKGEGSVDRGRIERLLGKENLEDEEVTLLVEERLRLRKIREYGKADEIRNSLKSKGISLRDVQEGTNWIRE